MEDIVQPYWLFDGDLVLLIDNPLMMKGVDRNAPIVIDIEDKVTAISERVTPQNRLKCILRSMTSIIGECSNCASAYHNKAPKTEEARRTHAKYVDLLSIINGKAIDYAKTGVLYNIPKHIAKYAKPLPYFMKYAGDYYAKLHKFSKTYSNMNRLCMELEKWEKTFRYKRTYKNFDPSIMYDSSIDFNEETFAKIEEIFIEFDKEIKELGKEAVMFKKYDVYKDELKDWIDKKTAENFVFNWNAVYDKYRNRCSQICPNQKELANYATVLCYDKYPSRNKKFLWRVAGEGVVANIAPTNTLLPIYDENGMYEYMGKRYSMVETIYEGE